jgi:multidrug resistance efflux pump
MGTPWTRDGTVRAYVVTMAPQVAGQIVQLPVADNQFMQNVEREAQRRQELTSLAVTKEEKQTYASNAVVAQAQYQQAVANLDQARVNLQRTQIRSPVNGWVTNLLAQLGDYANVGTSSHSSMPTRSGSTVISRRRTSSRSASAIRPRSS